MTDLDLVFRESFARSIRQGRGQTDLFERFYQIFQSSSEEVAEKFKGTDMVAQRERIRADLFELWLDCLVQTARELDPAFDPIVETAWRVTFAPRHRLHEGRALRRRQGAAPSSIQR